MATSASSPPKFRIDCPGTRQISESSKTAISKARALMVRATRCREPTICARFRDTATNSSPANPDEAPAATEKKVVHCPGLYAAEFGIFGPLQSEVSHCK